MRGMGGRGVGKKKKIGKEGRLSPVINGGIPAWWEGGRGRRGCVGERPGFIEKKNTACLA